jgi:uncharacterized repeat protein (TIGR01451 family)
LHVNASGANGKSFGIFVDNEPGNPIFLGEFLDGAWHTVTASFVATSASHTIIFAAELDARTAGVAGSSDVSYYIDNVSLAAAQGAVQSLTVAGTAAIHAAGLASVPDSFGGATAPPSCTFAAGSGKVLAFSSVTGGVSTSGPTLFGPDGTLTAALTVLPFGGISGITSSDASSFLVGVFLDSNAPNLGNTPPTLVFTGAARSYTNLSPALQQVFFVGDGLTGSGAGSTQTINVPTTATRLFLGYADACGYSGPPGCYFDNLGSVAATFSVFGAGPFPDLTVTKSHAGNFTQGQTGATYTLSVTNSGGSATSRSVTVADTLPASLAPTAIGGPGWNCVLSTLTCTRSDILSPGTTYPAITLTVNVAPDAPASVTNTVTVEGGGEANTLNDAASDVTAINAAPDLTVTYTHSGSFLRGQTSATYTITASNVGGSATTGLVTVVDSVPAGLTATAISGSGWACVLGTLICTRGDALEASGSYPVINLTVDVANTAVGPVTSRVIVSGGGELNTANDGATDVANITAPVPVLAGLVLQLDASNGLAADGSTWNDVSSNGHNATALAGQAPTVQPNALNGLPVAVFSGNQALAVAGQVLTSQQFTVMAVVTDTSGPTGPQLRDVFSNWDNSNSVTSVFLGDVGPNSTNHPTTTAARFTDALGGGTSPSSNNGVGVVSNPTQTFVLLGESTPTDAVIWQNGTPIASLGSPLPARNLATAYYIGKQGTLSGDEYWRGYIAEVLVYNRALTSAEASDMVSYLNAKWLGQTAPQSPYPTAVLADNPVAYYRLDEAVGSTVAMDASGRGHSGAYERSPVLGMPGLINDPSDTAVDFTNGDVAIPNATDLNFVNVPFTIEAWVKGAQGSTYQRVFDKIVAGQATGYGLDLAGNSIRVLGCSNFSPQVQLSATTAYHVVAVSDGGGTGSVYLDGTLLASGPYAACASYVGSAHIGVANDGEAQFAGVIDEVAVYNYALSSARILAHYNAGAPLPQAPAGSITITTDYATYAAGQTVNVSGQFSDSTGIPIPNAPISIQITQGATNRLLNAVTGATGQYSVAYQPLPSDAGTFQVSATGISAGVTKTAMTSFQIYGA